MILCTTAGDARALVAVGGRPSLRRSFITCTVAMVRHAFLLSWFAMAASQPKPLSFSGGKFTLAQLADLHYGEGESVWWGPVQDANSTRVVQNIIAAEAQLDFLIYSGDQVTGNNVDTNATAYLRQVYETPAAAGIPWATIFGNHDDAPLEPLRRTGSVTTRTELSQFELEAFPNLSHTQLGPASLAGVSNYFLPVLADANADPGHPALLLYFIDSGGGSYAEEVFPNQVSWLNETIYYNAARYGEIIPSLAFVHIPTQEFVIAYVPPGPGSRCFGELADDGVSPTVNDTGLFSLLAGATGAPVRNTAVFVGHDHGNAWCCNVEGMWACFGRHSGYGGYGNWDRGSRIIQAVLSPSGVLPLSSPSQPAAVQTRGPGLRRSVAHIETWVRMEDGSVNSRGCLFPATGAMGCPPTVP